MNLADLGRRAVACKHWKWMPGMLMSAGMTTFRIRFDGDENVDRCGVPDLSDPATLGCLLHLVREAWGRDAYIEVNKYERNGGRYLCDTQVGIAFPGQTEAEALVGALEAAP